MDHLQENPKSVLQYSFKVLASQFRILPLQRMPSRALAIFQTWLTTIESIIPLRDRTMARPRYYDTSLVTFFAPDEKGGFLFCDVELYTNPVSYSYRDFHALLLLITRFKSTWKAFYVIILFGRELKTRKKPFQRGNKIFIIKDRY